MIIDISPTLSGDTAVWPGDVSLKRTMQMRLTDGDSVDLSSLTTTVHLGAHADAPGHFATDGVGIDQVDLEPYLGPCHVIEVFDQPLILEEHCLPALSEGAKRLLFKTCAQSDPNTFGEEFAAFSADAVAAMGRKGVLLIGIDTPSVDPFSSKELPAHNQLAHWGMRNLEGLVLDQVAPGEYELIALPLKLKDFDASPVRAVLRSLG